MKRFLGLVLLVLLGAGFFWGMDVYPQGFFRARDSRWFEEVPVEAEFIFYHVKKLASPEFRGRAPGTEGGSLAAQYIARQFQMLDLKPGGDSGTYFQAVRGPSFSLQKQENRWKPKVYENELFGVGNNVLGFLGPGEMVSHGSTIIISAHYDHLGEQGNNYFPGANDNASGIGVLLEVARSLASRSRNPRVNILFAAWTYEEEGLYGSKHFVSKFPLQKIKAVINLDTLGNGGKKEFLIWLHQQKNFLVPLIIKTGSELGLHIQSKVLPPQTLHTSDHQPFAEQEVPAVTLLSSAWLEKNHTFQDTPDEVNPEKLETAMKLIIAVVNRIAY